MTKKTRENCRRRRRRKENTKEREGAQRKRAEESAPTDDVSTIYKYIHTYKRRRVLRNSSLGGLKTGGAWKETHLKIQIRNSWVDLQTQHAFFDEQRWSSSPHWVWFNRQAAKSKLCCSETMVRTKHFDEKLWRRGKTQSVTYPQNPFLKQLKDATGNILTWNKCATSNILVESEKRDILMILITAILQLQMGK